MVDWAAVDEFHKLALYVLSSLSPSLPPFRSILAPAVKLTKLLEKTEAAIMVPPGSARR
jgi:hypothetical protein